jgi:hypothetical protein
MRGVLACANQFSAGGDYPQHNRRSDGLSNLRLPKRRSRRGKASVGEACSLKPEDLVPKIVKKLAVAAIICMTATVVLAETSGKPALNPDVTQATIASTICTTGWTRTVRPYVFEMKKIKADMLATIGEPIERRNYYELDHVIPLALGGAVVDRRNLALQPIDEARKKDAIEVCLSSLVCQGKIELEVAQSAIWEDWRKAGELCGAL